LFPQGGLLGLSSCRALLQFVAACSTGAAFGSSLSILERHRRALGAISRSPWFYTSTGMGMWLVSETMGLVYAILEWSYHWLTPADLVWLIGCLVVLIGLWKGLRPLVKLVEEAGLGVLVKAVWAVSLVLGVVALISTAIGGAGLADVPRVIRAALALALLALSLEGVALFYGGSAAKSMAAVSLGLVFLALGALASVFVEESLLRIAGYALMAVGLYSYSKHVVVL